MCRLIVLILCLPVCLFAQKKDIDVFGKGWYLSLAVQAEIKSEFNLTPFVTSADTLPRNLTVFRNPPPRSSDTVLIDGNETLYYLEPRLQERVRREKAIFNLLTSIRLHYRAGDRFEFSAGFFYQPTYTDELRTDETSGFPDDFYYSSSVSEKSFSGLLGDFNYHLRKGKRLRPYVGLQARFGILRSTFIGSRRVFPRLDRESELVNNIRDNFRENTILDYDLALLAGLNYQLNDRLLVGVESNLSRFLIPIPRALQLRYRLGKNREERR